MYIKCVLCKKDFFFLSINGNGFCDNCYKIEKFNREKQEEHDERYHNEKITSDIVKHLENNPKQINLIIANLIYFSRFNFNKNNFVDN
jgi:hypothetical protein